MQPNKIVAYLRPGRGLIGATVVILTVVLFVRFFAHHPQYLTSLKHVSLWAILAIIALNAALLVTIAIINQTVLTLCGHKLAFKEQLLLTAYSSLANFFGPLQSGPGIRAVYLKTKYHIRLRDYTLATLVGYGFLAMISALFLIGGSCPWWQSLMGCLAVGLVGVVVIKWFMRKRTTNDPKSDFQLHWRPIVVLLLATIVQVIIVSSYYFIELRAVGVHASFHQVASYTGAANFALFVALTPDAIGIRESFLVLAKRLHHLGTAAIITANVLDRAAYALFLGLLFLIILAFHAKDRLGISQPTTDQL